jgi:hypothetical protein
MVINALNSGASTFMGRELPDLGQHGLGAGEHHGCGAARDHARPLGAPLARLFEEITDCDDYVEFLTLPAYARID